MVLLYQAREESADADMVLPEDLPFEVINTVTFGAHMSINNKLKLFDHFRGSIGEK